MTLDEVCDRVRKDDIGKYDRIQRVQDISLHHGRLTWPGADDDGFGFSLTPWATAQACTRLGIPTAYYVKCPFELQDQQFCFWKDQLGRAAWTLRAKDTSIRGVLSERYEKLDNRQLLEALMTALAGTRWEVKLFELTPESFHLRVIDPRVCRLALPGDPLMVAIHIANSEVGMRAVSVDACVYRQICSNGAVRRIAGKSLMRQRHIHLGGGRFVPQLVEAIGQATAVAAAFMEQMILSLKVPVPDPERAIQILVDAWKLPQQTAEYIRFGLHGEQYPGSLYALLNATTNAAQRLPVDDRVSLETLATLLIDTTDTSREGHLLRQRILAPKSTLALAA